MSRAPALGCCRVEGCAGRVPRFRLIALAVVIAVVGGGMAEQARASSTAPARTQSAHLQARAAFVPLVAVMVCTRVCPVAGVAAARILRRAPKQIRPVRAPRPAAANAFATAAGSSPSRALGLSLARGSADDAATARAAGFVAHHIVAVKDSRASFARMVLHLRGIGPNTAANGVWLKRSMHTPIHTNAYYANVNAVTAKYFFSPARPTSELVNDLARIGRLLQKGQLPL